MQGGHFPKKEKLMNYFLRQLSKGNLNYTERLDIFCPEGQYDIIIQAYNVREKIVKTIESTFLQNTRFGEVTLKNDGRLYFDETITLKTKNAVVQLTEDGSLLFDENFKVKKKK